MLIINEAQPILEDLSRYINRAKEHQAEMQEEFALVKAMIIARKKAGKTQAEVAKSMHTTTSVVGRLEAANTKHSPSVVTLQRYAKAIGCELSVKFIAKSAAKNPIIY